MDKEEIAVTIKPDGTVEITPLNLKGPACLLATKELEQALGTVTKRERTAAFYEEAPAGNRWQGVDEG